MPELLVYHTLFRQNGAVEADISDQMGKEIAVTQGRLLQILRGSMYWKWCWGVSARICSGGIWTRMTLQRENCWVCGVKSIGKFSRLLIRTKTTRGSMLFKN